MESIRKLKIRDKKDQINNLQRGMHQKINNIKKLNIYKIYMK
jgi:hypothetical protein